MSDKDGHCGHDGYHLAKYLEDRMPEIVCRWKGLMREGYEARMAGEPRQWHGRRYSGPFFKGWDEADRELKKAKLRAEVQPKVNGE